MKRYFVLTIVSMLSLMLVACKANENTVVEPTELVQNEEVETTEEIISPTENVVTINNNDFQTQLSETEKIAAEIENELFTSTTLTQSEMNKMAKNLFDEWDELINSQWSILKDTLDADTMASLTEEQLEWIDEKEKEAIAAGEKYKGGSLEPMERYLTEASLTKERVYELAEYLK